MTAACASCGRRPKPAKRERETADYAATVRRMIRAHGRRVAAGDPADLPDLVALRRAVDAAIVEAVRGQRELFSWADIAAGLGTTRQSAHERYAEAIA